VDRDSCEVDLTITVLEYLAVNPEYRRRGVGEKLVTWGIQQADKHGLDTVLEATLDGGKLYRKLGFEDAGKIEYKSVSEKFITTRDQPDLMFMRRPARSSQ
jgi:ribosomal protein S18 acetylase RimI-like enzyme